MPSSYYRLLLTGTIQFETAFHIGSGLEGEMGSDAGILTDIYGYPILPGSSLKGVLRSTIEKLVASLDIPKFWTCGLDNNLYGTQCIGGGITGNETLDRANEIYQNTKETKHIAHNRCTVCTLFGCTLSAGRLFIDDALLAQNDWETFRLQSRNGVGLDRDSGVSVDGALYDYDVANSGLAFPLKIELEQPKTEDIALLGIGILEWLHTGLRLGGKTTRGLGKTTINDLCIKSVDFNNPEEKRNYILNGKLPDREEPKEFFQQAIEKIFTRGKEVNDA